MVNSRTNSVKSQSAIKVVDSEWISMSSLLFCVLTINPLLIRWILYRTRAILSSLLILLQSATTWPDPQKLRWLISSDQGLSDDVWLINVTSLMTLQSNCNLLQFLMNFPRIYAHAHPPTTKIFAWKWLQEWGGSFYI